MRALMEQSLAEAQERKAGEAPLRERGAAELAALFGGGPTLGALCGAGHAGELLLHPACPLRPPLVAWLDLERKCGRWWPCSRHRFAAAAAQLLQRLGRPPQAADAAAAAGGSCGGGPAGACEQQQRQRQGQEEEERRDAAERQQEQQQQRQQQQQQQQQQRQQQQGVDPGEKHGAGAPALQLLDEGCAAAAAGWLRGQLEALEKEVFSFRGDGVPPVLAAAVPLDADDEVVELED